MPINVEEELDLCKAEKGARAPMDSWWQSINEVCVPRNAYVNRSRPTGAPPDDFDRIFDTTIIESVEGLSNMMTAQLTPAGQIWLLWMPPFEFEDDDEIIEWYVDSSIRMMKLVNNSNFQVPMSDVNLERAAPGSSLLMAYETGVRYAPVRFKHSPVGTYTFSQDLDGRADGLRREFQATAHQLKKEWPNGNFGPRVTAAFNDRKKRNTQKFTIWHITHKREERDDRYLDAVNMPYAEFYICEEDKNVIEETGQHEFVGMVTRFQSGADGSQWGVSPARKAMPAAAQANYLKENLGVLLDVQINPRILAEAGMIGEIDMRPGAKTLVRAGALSGSQPGVRQWLDGGRYDMGKDMLKDSQDQVRKLFYHGMWADLARVEKEMTAEEVRQIRDQSELLFVGVNARFESDMSKLMGQRLFGIGLRAGVFKRPPARLMRNVSGAYLGIPDPTVTYQSNLSRVLLRKAVENSDMFMTRLERMAVTQPGLLDEFDFSVHVRELARTFGFKAPFIRPKNIVTEILGAKIAAAERQQQQAQAMAVAETASKFDPATQQQLIRQAA